jgi:hypothetical protein
MKLDNLTDLSRMDVLRSLGLAPRMRDYIWPALGLFTTGVLLGAGAALLLAPKSGAKLRAEIRDELRSRVDEIERKLGVKHSNQGEAQDTAQAA